LFFRKEDIEDLSEKIVKLLNDEGLREKFKENI